MKALYSKSLVTKSLVRTGIIVASLALAGNAFAANASTAHHVVHHAAAAKYPQFTQQQFNLPDFVAAAFGGFAVPLVTQASRATGTHAAVSSDDNSQVFDTPPADVEVDNSQSQAAIDETDQAIQQTDQDTFQMDESVINSNNGM
jgi:hypothetical protein